MHQSTRKGLSNFPDPLASKEEKLEEKYGLSYAKAIESQWGKMSEKTSLFGTRNEVFEKNRDYANGTQDTSIYKQLLTALNPQDGDGSLLNLDFTPVPILPKFVRVVVNKILSRDPYPNLEAIDPISSSEKNREKKRIRTQVEIRKQLEELKAVTNGLVMDEDPDMLPETIEEAEIFLDTNIKTDAEIAAQIGTNMTLSWNNFSDSIFRRCVNDIASLGMSVVKRTNDPNYGIKLSYVDPVNFIHSYTEDPSFEDMIYAGNVRKITIEELKRVSGDQISDEELREIKKTSTRKNSDMGYNSIYDSSTNKKDYDENMIEVLDFEFISLDTMHFEEKENQYGNVGFFYEGFERKERKASVYERTPHKMDIYSVYEGTYVLGTDTILNYGLKSNMPKNVHDISKANLSYSVVSTNMRRSKPKSMVDSCIGFADMLQITHLKIQQAIAKAKPDGLIIDIEGLENVQLGKGGDLDPLDLHDIYEKTGVFYYRSKNPEGGFQNPPVREIGNHIRNINELITLYNHYLNMIRDATGINEMMDASTPKGETLVGVQQSAIAAGNNATYDITNASMILFKKVCEDVVKCLQILPEDSVIMEVYKNAVGEENMNVLSSFSDLPMYNFGVYVEKDMEDNDKMYLEQNLQVALAQKEIDLEDAIAVRNIKDVNQAERLLVVRRKKRIAKQQEVAMQNSQMQAQQAQQAAQAASQAKMQEAQMEAQLEAQKIQLKAQAEIQVAQAVHQFKKEIEIIRAQATLGFKEEEKNFKEKLEVLKENRKDDRIEKEAAQQSKLISQRQGKRGEISEVSDTSIPNLVESFMNQ